MVWTMIIGKALYGGSVYCYWLFVGQDSANFFPGFIFASVTFAGGIVTGIVGNTLGKAKKGPSPGTPTHRRLRST